MSKKKDIERLARFMGWVRGIQVGGDSTTGQWWFDGIGAHPPIAGGNDALWDPFEFLDDAMMVAEKIGEILIQGPIAAKGGDYAVWFDGPYELPYIYEHPLPKAITLAALAYLDAVEKK